MFGAAILFALMAASDRPDRLPPGLWGGDHVRLTVRKKGAEVVFDCAHGKVDGAIALDEKGAFDAQGEFVREHGGPIRVGEVEKKDPARYQGTLDGTTLTLRVVLENGAKTLGPFTLSQGSNGRLWRCY
jgi:hypothetical protein